MTNLLTGGRMHTPGTSSMNRKATIFITSIIAFFLIICGTVMIIVTSLTGSADLNNIVLSTAQRINTATASNTSIQTIINNPAPYTGLYPHQRVLITPTSCGTTNAYAYTITATDKQNHISIYTSTTQKMVYGTIADKRHLLMEVCTS